MLRFRGRMVLMVGMVLLLLPAGPRTARAGDLPASAWIPGFTGHAQGYSLSCESRSAVDWAAFWGVSITEGEFLAGLPSSDNPDVGFVGSPSDGWGNIPPNSYGVHARPVALLLNRYGLQARSKRGLQWDDLRLEIAAGRPVIVWVIGPMWPGTRVTYTAADGKKTTVARYEHTMVLIGYDPSVVQVVDAYSGWSQTYPIDTFLASWAVLGNMAVLGHGANRQAPASPMPTPKRPRKMTPSPSASGRQGGYTVLLPLVFHSPATLPAKQTPPRRVASQEHLPSTYVVQHGDYLIALAEHFGLDWRDLAARNGIGYPFVIYPGQVLKFR